MFWRERDLTRKPASLQLSFCFVSPEIKRKSLPKGQQNIFFSKERLRPSRTGTPQRTPGSAGSPEAFLRPPTAAPLRCPSRRFAAWHRQISPTQRAWRTETDTQMSAVVQGKPISLNDFPKPGKMRLLARVRAMDRQQLPLRPANAERLWPSLQPDAQPTQGSREVYKGRIPWESLCPVIPWLISG